jgi:aminoglycoside phosphotransferase (APT) family kinase protein
MAMPSTRDVEKTSVDVARWLAERLAVEHVDIGEISSPKAGFSNETLFLTATWSGADGEHCEQLVLRIEPTLHQLFVEPDAMFQAAMMSALARHPGTPVPKIWFTETDASILGAPFFVMERRHGHIPADVPSFNVKGFTTELSPERRERLYDSAIDALVALHRIDWTDGFGFLGADRAGRAWPTYLEELSRMYEWSAPSRIFATDRLDEAYRFLLENAPEETEECIVWGDARVGNLMFDDEQNVIAMFDWETASLGPPGIDLGWWLMFEDFLSEAQGVAKLDGIPDRAEIIKRYEQASGRTVAAIDYFELLACVVMAIINSRLGHLLLQSHKMTEVEAGTWARRSIDMATERLVALRAARA